MEKSVIAFVLLVCTILSPVPVSANTPVEDAFTVDSETRAILSASEDDTVIRVYFGIFMYGFSLRQSIEDIFNDGWSLHGTYYLIASNDKNGEQSLVCKCVEDGAVVSQEYESGSFYAKSIEQLHKNNLTYYDLIGECERILSALGPFVTAEKTVFMHGLPVDGMYIYYETNIGNYVYYKDHPEAEEEYLVPLETFYDYAEVVQAARSGTAGGSRADVEAYDLSPYSLKNYTATPRKIFFTILLYGIPILLVTCVCIGFVVRKKRKS